MKKLNVYLSDSQYDRLRQLQAQEDLPLAELVRRAVDDFLAQQMLHTSLRLIRSADDLSLYDLTILASRLEQRFAALAQRPMGGHA